MGQVRVRATAPIAAAPERVMAILRDYHEGHVGILPREHFPHLEVLSGGQGAGTRFLLTSRMMGRERRFDMEVSEPEPGRRLEERDRLSDLVTTFTVEPAPGGSTVTIESVWKAPAGVMGWMERLLTPRLLAPVYHKELANLADAVATPEGSRR